MATGIIGVVSGSGGLTYTPQSDTKVGLVVAGMGSAAALGINGATNSVIVPAGSTIELTLWVGAGQTLTLTTGNSTTAFTLTALESLS